MDEPHCPKCGWHWSQFREEGLVGCEACYDAFAPELVAALKRPEVESGPAPTLQAGSEVPDLVS